jgi:hypothetical protein
MLCANLQLISVNPRETKGLIKTVSFYKSICVHIHRLRSYLILVAVSNVLRVTS